MLHVPRPNSSLRIQPTSRRRRHLCALVAGGIALLACARDLSAQASYQVVAELASIGGASPLGGLIAGPDGALYGTTSEGGTENCGIVYRLDAAGQLSLIHEFSAVDGCQPVGELALGADGSFYGVTTRGGDADPQRAGGTIYKIAVDGTFTVLHRFILEFAGNPTPWLVPFGPSAGLVLAADGFFYGTTMSADIFRISPEGAFALVDQFATGSEPQDLIAALVVAADGHLYTTSPIVLSVQPSPGSIFRVSLGGDAEVVYLFRDFGNPPPGSSGTPDGANPEGELAAGPDGELYGVNRNSGPSENDRGTIFRREPDGTVTVLHAFSEGANQSYPDGAHPRTGLILAADGSVYGTTSAGGANGNGTIFRISPGGVFTTLRSFAQDGFSPTKGRLLELTPGVFYGTAPSATGGVVYRLTVSAPLAISLVAPKGGAKVHINEPTTIEWTATGVVGIDVELSRDGGNTFAPIPECSGLAGSSTSCVWTPTGPRTPKAQVRVVAHDAGGGQASDVTTVRIKK
jgi:uncharacterized repeat protein (TIGR03803 family)